MNCVFPWLVLVPALAVGAPRYVPSAVSTRAAAGLSLSASGNSSLPQFSADGCFLVFVSDAPNLVTNDDGAAHLDVFAHELATGRNVLVSVNTNGVGGGNESANYPSVSADGHVIAFASAASNLAPGDTNIAADIFVRDLRAGTTRIVSTNLGARIPSAFTPAASPQVSADGRYVLLEGSDPFGSSTTVYNQVYLYDVASNRTILVSRTVHAMDPGNGHSRMASMTPDAQFVVFASQAWNLDGYTTHPCIGLYRVPPELPQTWATPMHLPADPVLNFSRGNVNPVLSADGQAVAYVACATVNCGLGSWPVLGGPASLVLSRAPAGAPLSNITHVLVATNLPGLTWPALSANGRWVAYEDGTNIHVWDAEAGGAELVNVNGAGTGPGNAPARAPVLSRDGTRVLFISAATDLVPEATNGRAQIFLRDRLAGTTALITVTCSGAASAHDHSAAQAVLNPDGTQVAFDSAADDLVPGDGNGAMDVFVRDVAAGVTTLISRRHVNRLQATDAVGSSLADGALSADGRWLVFAAADNPLLAGDTNGWVDLFLRDLSTGDTTRLGVDPDGAFDASSVVSRPQLSSDAQRVLFLRRPPGRPPAGTNEVYWWDRTSGPPHRLILSESGSAPVPAENYALSPDGRWLAFQSALPAQELAPGVSDLNGAPDVFVRDLVAGTNAVISVNPAGVRTGNRGATNLLFSPDGRWVLFSSSATDLVADVLESSTDLFGRDLVNGMTRRLSANALPSGYARFGGKAVFSGDSRRVAYVRRLYPPYTEVFVHDLATGTVERRCAGCDGPALNQDGSVLAAQLMSLDYIDNRPTNVVVIDFPAGTSNLVGSAVAANHPPAYLNYSAPQLDASGRFVVFRFQPITREFLPYSNYWIMRFQRRSDGYVFDRYLNAALLLSPSAAAPRPANGCSGPLLFAPNTRTAVYASFASDLVSGDFNGRPDLFVVRLGGEDSDGDHLDDDWELAYFDSLDRDGASDSDGDGADDAAEFHAGTDPTNRGSVLQVLTITSPGASGTTVLWSAVPGRSYRVEFKETADAAGWATVATGVTPGGTTGSALDPSASGRSPRFYRVMVE